MLFCAPPSLDLGLQRYALCPIIQTKPWKISSTFHNSLIMRGKNFAGSFPIVTINPPLPRHSKKNPARGGKGISSKRFYTYILYDLNFINI